MSNGSERTPERTWLRPGDRVRLTGEDWIHLGLHGQTVRVVDIDIDGDALIEDPNGGMLAVYSNPGEGDYSAERVDGEPDPWEGFTGESPEEAAYAEGWKDAREHDTFTALRDRIVALEAVLVAAKAEANRLFGPAGESFDTDKWGDLAREVGAPMHALLALAPSVVLDGMIREAKAEALLEVVDEWSGKTWLSVLSGELTKRALAYRNGDA